MTGTAYAGSLDLVVSGTSWRRRQSPPVSLTVLERASEPLLVMPTDLSGGQRGGDTLSVHVAVQAGGEVDWRPPASSLYYPSQDGEGECRVDQHLEVESRASLSWIPRVAIPCAGARVSQSTQIEIETGAELLFWEGWADGRTSSGERGAFESLANQLVLKRDGCVVYQERWKIGGNDLRDDHGPAGFQGACQWYWGLASGTEAAQKLATQVVFWQSRGESAEYGLIADGLWLARALTRTPRDPFATSQSKPISGQKLES